MDAPAEVIAGRYRLVRRVGSGGMGVVWEAWDERLHRTVAVKQLHAQLGLSEAENHLVNERAMREARITARLDHPNAVPVFDVVEHDGRPCLIMQFLPSKPLSEVLRERQRLPAEEVARMGAQVASGLAAAHRLGIVHRDVKPGNVLIADDGTARISDFGISHALGDVTLTSTGMMHGTPAYLAPEVARGAEASSSSDVFGLGATLYAAVEGSPPFGVNQNSIALLYKVASGEYDPPSPGGVLTPLLNRMLAPNPDDRPAMGDVAFALGGLAAPAAAAIADTEASTRVNRSTTRSTPWASSESVERSDGGPVGGTTVPFTAAGVPAAGSQSAAPRTPTYPTRDDQTRDDQTSDDQTSDDQTPTDLTAPDHAAADRTRVARPAGGDFDSHPATGPVRPAVAAAAAPRRSLNSGGAAPVAPGFRDSGSAPGRGRRRLVGALVALVVLVGIGALLVTLVPALQRDRAGADPGAGTNAPTSTAPSPAGSESPSASASSKSPSPSSSASSKSPSPAPATSRSPSPTPTRTRSTPPPSSATSPTAGQLREAVAGYYAQMPEDTDAGWSRLTASYQRGSAGSRRSYERFWDDIDDVSVSNIQGIPPNRAEATVTYRLKGDSTSIERTAFEFVREDGELKINETRVLRSSRR